MTAMFKLERLWLGDLTRNGWVSHYWTDTCLSFEPAFAQVVLSKSDIILLSELQAMYLQIMTATPQAIQHQRPCCCHPHTDHGWRNIPQ
jgi:hypothetical protein